MAGEQPDPGTTKPEAFRQDTWELVAEGDWLVGQRFPITRHAVLGRDSSCDITIPGTHLSRRHAELAVKGRALLIRDLNSSNGTFVNDRRITEIALKPGDSVRFDVLRFKVHGPDGTLAGDDDATRVRPPAAERKPRPQKAPAARQNRPVAADNRDAARQASTAQHTASPLWTILAVIVGVGMIAGIAYLITFL